jgi:hypothetical protein
MISSGSTLLGDAFLLPFFAIFVVIAVSFLCWEELQNAALYYCIYARKKCDNVGGGDGQTPDLLVPVPHMVFVIEAKIDRRFN